MTEPEDQAMDHFSQEAHAFMDLNETKEMMVEEARSVLRKHPEADPVGLLFQRDAPLALGMAEALEKATGQRIKAKGFLGVMPRHVANQILKDQAPDLLEQLAHAQEGKGSVRQLPIICVTRSGAKMLLAGFDAPEASEGEME